MNAHMRAPERGCTWFQKFTIVDLRQAHCEFVGRGLELMRTVAQSQCPNEAHSFIQSLMSCIIFSCPITDARPGVRYALMTA